MDKVTTLKLILNAKKDHLDQMQKIEIAMSGGSVSNPTSVEKTQSAFGLWLYNEDSNLRKVLGAMFYDKIENYHSIWHNEYKNIHEILFKKEVKSGFLSKLTGAPKINEMELDKAKLYYSELKDTTEELIKITEASHRRLEALPESKFE